ncbi:MAG TPA: nucleotidyl transferase AbiEii/AbiGii toxin family protein, partial [Streptosporangiaceae bacterium]
GVNLSFLRYRYRRLRPLLDWSTVPCRLASLDDLACMKLGAAVQRGTRKDFVDVYALGTAHRPLRELLGLYQRKFGIADPGHVLVGLSYFDDAERSPMPPMLWRVTWKTVRKTIESWVKEITG